MKLLGGFLFFTARRKEVNPAEAVERDGIRDKEDQYAH
jgi:hypothetical protein